MTPDPASDQESWKTVQSFPMGCFASFLVILGMLFVCGGTSQVAHWRTAQWRSAPGVIDLFGGNEEDTEQGDQYLVIVAYYYTVNGVLYRGDNFNSEQSTTVDRGKYQELAKKYFKGKAVTIYYNPADADQSMLERNNGASGLAIIAGGALCAVGFLLGAASRFMLKSKMQE